MDRGIWQAAVRGVTKSQARLKQLNNNTRGDILKFYELVPVTSFQSVPFALKLSYAHQP